MWQGMARRQDAKKLHPGPLSASSTQAQIKQAGAIQRSAHLRVLGTIRRHFEKRSESTNIDMRHQRILYRAPGNMLRACAKQHPLRVHERTIHPRDDSLLTKAPEALGAGNHDVHSVTILFKLTSAPTRTVRETPSARRMWPTSSERQRKTLNASTLP